MTDDTLRTQQQTARLLVWLVPALWSVVLQIMGLSEVHQVRFRGALGARSVAGSQRGQCKQGVKL